MASRSTRARSIPCCAGSSRRACSSANGATRTAAPNASIGSLSRAGTCSNDCWLNGRRSTRPLRRSPRRERTAVALLDRYLTAVAFWLPAKEGADVTAELRDDIQSDIEARETTLGRVLTEAELEAILTRLGHPMRVAERYLPQRSLIGPALLPVYRTGLTVLGSVAGVWLLVIAAVAAVEPAWASGDRVAGALNQLVTLALIAFAVLTLVFAMAERWTARAGTAWTAASLSSH